MAVAQNVVFHCNFYVLSDKFTQDESAYRVRAVDYWNRPGKYSETAQLP